MSKNKDRDFVPAENYLAHLEWHSKHRSRYSLWASPEPRWKYKIVYRKSDGRLSGPFLFLFASIVISIAGYLLYEIIVLRSGLAIFAGIVFIVILVILYFAARDVGGNNSSESNDDSKPEQK